MLYDILEIKADKVISRAKYTWWQHEPLAVRRKMSNAHRKKCMRDLEKQGIGWRAYGNIAFNGDMSDSALKEAMEAVWKNLTTDPPDIIVANPEWKRIWEERPI